MLCTFVLSSCNSEVGNSLVIIEIHEETFVKQIDNIRYYNPEEYLGAMIKLEGIYKFENTPLFVFKDDTGTEVLGFSDPVERHSIGRNLEHEYDFESWIGFRVLWDGKRPDNYSWVEAIGIFEFAEPTTEGSPGGYFLNLTSLTVLHKRGLETVPR
jgi:hypothetical protein